MSILKCQTPYGSVYYTIVNAHGYIFKSSAWGSEYAAIIAYDRDPSYYESFGWTYHR